MSLLEEVRENKTLAQAGRELAAAGRNVWLAGLGALAQVTRVTKAAKLAEAGEEGRKLFGELVEKGRPVAARRRQQVDALVERAAKEAKDLGKLAQDQAAYEGRRMLKRLNLMTREDVKILSKRIDVLSHKLDELAGDAPVLLDEAADNNSVAEGKTPTPRQRRTAKR
jgi:polyhydroxyalkanoate synthesis regulator phasin